MIMPVSSSNVNFNGVRFNFHKKGQGLKRTVLESKDLSRDEFSFCDKLDSMPKSVQTFPGVEVSALGSDFILDRSKVNPFLGSGDVLMPSLSIATTVQVSSI